MIERKCTKCQTWNQEEKFCKNCGTALAPDEIEKIEEAKRQEWRDKQPRPKLDILLEKAKNHKNPVVRILFYILYSAGIIIFAIGSFITYLVAWSPG